MLVVGIVIIGFLVGLVIGIIAGEDFVARILLGLGGALIYGASVAIVAIALQIGAEIIFNQEYEEYSKEEIVSLVNTHEQDGTFFLGSGSIEGNQEYYYMVETDRGINIKSVDAGDSYISEDNNTTPYIEYRKKVFTNKIVEKLFLSGFSKEYIIKIPEKSIKYNFEVGL